MLQKVNPSDNFLFAPDDAAAAAATPETKVTPEIATETPKASQTPSTPVSSGQADSTQTATATTTQQPQSSWLDSFRSEGFAEADENVARQKLLQAYRDSERLRPLAPALSAYQQHAEQFHAWLADQQKQAAKPQTEDWTAKLGWNPPVADLNTLRRQVMTDAQGNIVPVPGAAPDAVVKYQAAQAYRQEQVEKLLENPFKYMEPAIRHIAQEIAQQHAQQNVGQYREQQEAQNFITQHSDWLFDKNADGTAKSTQVLNTQTGRYESQKSLSKWGQIFVQNLQTAAQRGLPSDLQQTFAMQAVQNAYMASPEYVQWAAAQIKPAVQPAAAASPLKQANEAFNKRANPPAAPNATSSGNSVSAPTKVTRANLEQVMLQRFRDEGVTI